MFQGRGSPITKIITIANQKGGVTKTTLCQHLSFCLAEAGRQVLCIDLDPQANLTASLVSDPEAAAPIAISGLMRCLLEDRELPPPGDYLTGCGVGVDLIAGSKELSRIESDLHTEMGTEQFLHEILWPLRGSYDYILIDTNRAASPLMVNALTAADSVLVPICPEFYSTEGLGDLITTVLKNRRRLNPSIQFEGIVFSRCNLRTNLYREIRVSVEAAFAGKMPIFETAIPETVKVSEAISRGLTVMEYAPESRAAEAYRALTKELIQHEPKPLTAREGCPVHVVPGGGSRAIG